MSAVKEVKCMEPLVLHPGRIYNGYERAIPIINEGSTQFSRRVPRPFGKVLQGQIEYKSTDVNAAVVRVVQI